MNTTLETVQDYINETRVLLLDTVAPYRYDDTSLVSALNLTLLEGRRLRPDLFVYRHKTEVPTFGQVDGAEIHMEPQFRLAMIYGICAHAFARDQDDVQDARAATFMQTFRYMLTGERPAPNPAGGSPGTAPGR